MKCCNNLFGLYFLRTSIALIFLFVYRSARLSLIFFPTFWKYKKFDRDPHKNLFEFRFFLDELSLKYWELFSVDFFLHNDNKKVTYLTVPTKSSFCRRNKEQLCKAAFWKNKICKGVQLKGMKCYTCDKNLF